MLKKEEYFKALKRAIPVLFSSLICKGYNEGKYFDGLLKEPFKMSSIVCIDGFWYYVSKELKRGGDFSLQSWRDKDLFSHIREEFDKRADELVASAEMSFSEYCLAYKRYMPALMLIFTLDKPAEEALRNALLGKLSKEEGEILMNELNIPLLDNYYKREEYDLVMGDDLEEHVKKYRFLYARYGDEREYTVKEAKEKLLAIDKKEFLAKRECEKESLRQSIARAKEVLGKDADLVDIFQYMIFYRTHRTDTMNKSSFLAIPMLKETASTFGLTYEEFIHCTEDELVKNELPSKEILQMRQGKYVFVLDDGDISCLIGEKAEEIRRYFQEEVSVSALVTGSVACKGIVRGVARIINNKNDFARVEVGDVIVTSMTTPDMIPIMKKAVAFVTDEGGVTCHAAIISRELKKPCIIGTKNATQVLHDGDMLEVDADKGVVRIL